MVARMNEKQKWTINQKVLDMIKVNGRRCICDLSKPCICDNMIDNNTCVCGLFRKVEE